MTDATTITAEDRKLFVEEFRRYEEKYIQRLERQKKSPVPLPEFHGNHAFQNYILTMLDFYSNSIDDVFHTIESENERIDTQCDSEVITFLKMRVVRLYFNAEIVLSRFKKWYRTAVDIRKHKTEEVTKEIGWNENSIIEWKHALEREYSYVSVERNNGQSVVFKQKKYIYKEMFAEYESKLESSRKHILEKVLPD